MTSAEYNRGHEAGVEEGLARAEAELADLILRRGARELPPTETDAQVRILQTAIHNLRTIRLVRGLARPPLSTTYRQ